nr:hypothetical protein [Candidatus Eremiobacteraeota bacterium]
GRQFGALADTLLLGTARSRVSVPGALGTTSWNAWRAYDRGHDALARWDLGGAAAAFGEAAQLDPDYALAQLWRAQTFAWMAEPPRAEWQTAAGRAAALAAKLAPAEQIAARALAALADRRYPEACALYRRLVGHDSLDFAAWYGLGDCQAQDERVVRDVASPSGWRFRSSYDRAIRAYTAALELVPSVHLTFREGGTARLASFLYTRPGKLRRGYAMDGRDTTWFAAAPSLAGDTLAFIPFPFADFAALRPGTMPSTVGAALARNRRTLLHVVSSWAVAFPRSADAWEQLALARESTGLLGDVTDSASAEVALARARALAATPQARLRLAAHAVRLLLKAGSWDDARRLADTVLAATALSDANGSTAALAALTGRDAYTARLLRERRDLAFANGSPVVSAPTLAAAGALLAHAAVGAWSDSVATSLAQVEALLRTQATGATLDSLRHALLRRALILAAPHAPLHAVTASRAVTGSPRGDLVAAFWSHDTATVTRGLQALSARRVNVRPEDLTLDAVLVESWLHLATTDTTGAVGMLDATLEALPRIPAELSSDIAASAALVYLMALRAHIAIARGDGERARRWASAVAGLWAEADPPLRVVAERLTADARRSPSSLTGR